MTGTPAPAVLPVWKSKIQPTCETSVDFTVDWSAKFGVVPLSTVRFQWGTRPAGAVTLSAINAGMSMLTPAVLTANASDGFYYLNVENTGSTPMATAAKLTMTQLKAGADGTCYVDISDMDAYPAINAAATGTGATTSVKSGAAHTAGSIVAVASVLGSALISVFLF
ncbi:hypothetical protein SmJEL517_g03187 [Synchytrium microbalum]|uniref:Uncharacterized protein n=1 Tax=Synchytrium microbalum TaxID=1806994 RepID=A0A507C3S1_9FUNG|nr:uncharacterized protein SmJEL517_g03187 [Synchytrium microbalum]TPX34038.1 hypothetical protein SmJEL517_g03187 [Synchytrium microbalum]